jgi:hypothetical protein
MSALGVHYALTRGQAQALLAAKTDKRLLALIEDIEEAWEKPFLVESDKAWDAIHRCLTDGSLLYESGDYPLNHCICGGRQLYRGRAYTVSYVTPRQVKDVAQALTKVTKKWMQRRYALIDASEYDGEMGDDDFQYTWDNALDVRRFYKKAAQAGRAVIFTVDC